MSSVSITEQTRLQVERAQRNAEEARERIRMGREGRVRPGPTPESPAAPLVDDEQATDYGAD